MNNFVEIFSTSFLEDILAGLSATGILAIISFLRLKFLRKKYDFIIGDWVGSYLLSDDKNLISQKIVIKANFWGKLEILLEEKSTANFIYKGKIDVVENTIYGYLKGQYHPGISFIVMKLPFNRKKKVSSMNGVFSGVTQKHSPASVKVHWSRSDISLRGLKIELGPTKRFLIIESDNEKQG